MGRELKVESGKCSPMANRRGIVLLACRTVRKLEVFLLHFAGGSGACRILERIRLHRPVKLKERQQPNIFFADLLGGIRPAFVGWHPLGLALPGAPDG